MYFITQLDGMIISLSGGDVEINVREGSYGNIVIYIYHYPANMGLYNGIYNNNSEISMLIRNLEYLSEDSFATRSDYNIIKELIHYLRVM